MRTLHPTTHHTKHQTTEQTRGPAMPESHELSREECARLLSTNTVGRVAVSTPDGPHIVPVNYVVHDEATFLSTTPYSVLGTHGRGALLAFEVDGVDHDDERGWSVVARGRAEVVDDVDELEDLHAGGGPRPWAAGRRTLVLRIPWAQLSGRRLGGDS